MDRELDPKQLAINELLQLLSEAPDHTAEIAALKLKVQDLESKLLAAAQKDRVAEIGRLDAIEKRLGALDRIEKAMGRANSKDAAPKPIKVVPMRDSAGNVMHYKITESE